MAEDTSIVSSADNDTPSQAGSQENPGEPPSARAGSLQDPQDGISSSEMSNGSLPHSRKPHWNGGHGPAHQDSHPATPVHLLHQHPHLVKLIPLLYLKNKLGEQFQLREPHIIHKFGDGQICKTGYQGCFLLSSLASCLCTTWLAWNECLT